VVSPVPTHPQHAGNRARVAALLEMLEQQGHALHFAHVEMEQGDHSAMRSRWGNRYHPIPYRRRRKTAWRRVVDRGRRLLDQDAAHTCRIDDWYDPATDEALERLDARFRFDVVLVEYVFLSRALLRFSPATLKIIDTHDVFTDRHKLYLANGQRSRWFSTTRKEEAKGLDRADLIFAIQEKEREELGSISRRPVVTVGHPVTIRPPEVREKARIILYLGSRNPINIQSMNHFVSRIFPSVTKELPGTMLYIGGNICEKIAPGNANVRLLGKVDDLAEAYASADLVINPMRYGTGLKIKNVEALGYSKPLVTTPCGAEGLEPEAGNAFLVADGDDEWVRVTLEALRDARLRSRLAGRAHAFATRWNERIERSLHEAVTMSGDAEHHRKRV